MCIIQCTSCMMYDAMILECGDAGMRGVPLLQEFSSSINNSGGLINVYSEIKGYNQDKSLEKTKEIYDTTLDILEKSSSEDITSFSAAMNIAQERIKNSK